MKFPLVCSMLLIAMWMTFTHGCPKHCECNHGSTTVNCSHKSLMFIPPHLPASTRVFDISGNFLGPVINGTWSYMRNVTDIDLSQNGIVRIIGCSFKGLFKLKRLNLMGNQIRHLQEDLFSDNTDLEVLNLSSNRLETLVEPAFKYLHHLKELYLSDNYFSQLKFGVRLQVLTNVEIFDLSYNNFGQISQDAFEMIEPWSTSVKRTLNLANCQITSIENGTMSTYHGLYELILSGNKDLSTENLSNILQELERKNLKRLDISYMDLSNIDTLFVDTQYLTLDYLNLSHNLISAVSNGTFDSIRNLNTVDISFNQLQSFSPEFAVFGNIKEFDISHNNISRIDGSIIELLSALEVFRASYNNFRHRSDVQISSLQHIKHLDLSFNHLDGMVLPGSTSEMEVLNLAGNNISVVELLPLATKLTKFDISYNNISVLGPFVFSATRSIKETFFRGNVITDVDHRAFLPNTPEVIDLSGNQLTQTHYCSWSDVRLLNLSNNRISNVDYHTFYTMNKLKTLDLSNNMIKTFHGDTFKHLSNLTHLDLSRNKMRTPKDEDNLTKLFQNLYSLITLNLSFNDLTFINSTALEFSKNTEVISLRNNKLPYIIPELFSKLEKLKQIDFSENPFDCGCDLIPLVKWMLTNKNVVVVNNSNTSYICNSPLERAGKVIVNYSVGVFECDVRLLYLSIFGSIGALLVLVVMVGGLVCHYYLRWRQEDLPNLKKAAAKEKELKIDRVRVTDKIDIEAYPNDLKNDIDKHVKLKLKPLQNGDVQTPSSIPDHSSGYDQTSKKLSFSQPNLENGYGPYIYPVHSQYPRSHILASENYPYSLTLANSSYPYNYGLANGYFIPDKKDFKNGKTDDEKKKKKAKLEKEKERKKKEKKKEKKSDKKEKKSDEKSRRHPYKSHPWKYNIMERYHPSARWDSMGRDRWQILQWNALNKRYHEGRNSDRCMTLPPPNKMPYNGYPVYPPACPRQRTHSLRPQIQPNKSQSAWELPNGWFTRRATLPDPRVRSDMQNAIRRHSEENERRKRKLSQEYRHWKRYGEDWGHEPKHVRARPYEVMQFIERRPEVQPARFSPTEVSFDPMLWVRSNGDLREKVRFAPNTDRAEPSQHQQTNFIPRSRSEIVYTGPSQEAAWEGNIQHQGNTELLKSVSVSEYGITRIPRREASLPDTGQRQTQENIIEIVHSAVERVSDKKPSTTDKSSSDETRHKAEIHTDEETEEVVCKTPDPDYPRDGIISGWV
ncbi:slit homolog 2 protein-like [Gigantopelta aegis]|uniref:slit homolog 2 protein-like n=1 Tax=Gigantopelta aegis TaxID=1735272 RepID=UPI001B88CA46|nr:slit homolog 2 protein-like [Gigantopelta aegis]